MNEESLIRKIINERNNKKYYLEAYYEKIETLSRMIINKNIDSGEIATINGGLSIRCINNGGEGIVSINNINRNSIYNAIKIAKIYSSYTQRFNRKFNIESRKHLVCKKISESYVDKTIHKIKQKIENSTEFLRDKYLSIEYIYTKTNEVFITNTDIDLSANHHNHFLSIIFQGENASFHLIDNLLSFSIRRLSNIINLLTTIERLKIKKLKKNTYHFVLPSYITQKIFDKFSKFFSLGFVNSISTRFYCEFQNMRFNKMVYVYDNPLNINGINFKLFDAEGSLTKKTDMIKDGKVVNLLNNLDVAHKFGKPPTGNAYRECYQDPVGISFFNIGIMGGNRMEGDILKSQNQLIYLYKIDDVSSDCNIQEGTTTFKAQGIIYRNGIPESLTPVFYMNIAFVQFLKNISQISKEKENCSSYDFPIILIRNIRVR